MVDSAPMSLLLLLSCLLSVRAHKTFLFKGFLNFDLKLNTSNRSGCNVGDPFVTLHITYEGNHWGCQEYNLCTDTRSTVTPHVYHLNIPNYQNNKDLRFYWIDIRSDCATTLENVSLNLTKPKSQSKNLYLCSKKSSQISSTPVRINNGGIHLSNLEKCMPSTIQPDSSTSCSVNTNCYLQSETSSTLTPTPEPTPSSPTSTLATSPLSSLPSPLSSSATSLSSPLSLPETLPSSSLAPSSSLHIMETSPSSSLAPSSLHIMETLPSSSLAPSSLHIMEALPSSSLASSSLHIMETSPSSSLAPSSLHIMETSPSSSLAPSSLHIMETSPSSSLAPSSLHIMEALPSSSLAPSSSLHIMETSPSSSLAPSSSLHIMEASLSSSLAPSSSLHIMETSPSSSLAPSSSLHIMERLPSSSLEPPSLSLSPSSSISSILSQFSLTSSFISLPLPISTLSSFTLSTLTPSPFIKCAMIDQWKQTEAGDMANGTCRKGTVYATRNCDSNGNWDTVMCHTSEQFNDILSKINVSQYEALQALSEQQAHIPPDQGIVLLDLIINQETNDNNDTADLEMDIVQVVLNISDNIQQNVFNNKSNGTSIVSQSLLTLDKFALNLRENTSTSIGNIYINVQQIQDSPNEKLLAVSYQGNSLTLPPEIFMSCPEATTVASFVYTNLSTLSPNAGKSLISPVISSTIGCNATSNLTQPVTMTFNLTHTQKGLNNESVVCAFWDFTLLNNFSLPSGNWVTEGCNVSSVNQNSVTCQCNHLTHFAILLSPRNEPPSETATIHNEILTIIGQILVPISLVCMLLVILTYTCLKSLWSMRNYIHVMLCGNLFVSQLIFLIGIEQTTHLFLCSAIAVVLQYMFLVTFMWMLMEGVVLYVTLVKVFIKYPTRYIAAFTIISYGAPAVYMMIVAPIGFLINTTNHSHYLYYVGDELVACWLSYESHFIWSFIGPVILIIIANFGFFIMSICIMRSHQKKTIHNKEAYKTKYWIKASLSLTIVMGIGWIGNILFFTKYLFFVAYIMTTFIAGQGIIIFILYVPLSSHVREAYIKWWQKKQSNYSVLSKLTFLSSLDTLSRDTWKKKSAGVTFENKNGQYELGTYETEEDDKNKRATINSLSTLIKS